MTIATRSFSVSFSTSNRIACFTSGNRSAGVIEPDTSRRKTKLLAGRFSVRHFTALQSNPQQAMARVPRTRRGIEIDRERLVAFRFAVIVAEIIDHLFDAHRILGRERAGVDETADVRVRSRVDIDREGGKRIGRRREKRILRNVIVCGRVEILTIPRRARSDSETSGFARSA